ncbi:MAG TPA: DUF2332 family protein [Polyangiaceae bacterium]|nr:DUF2332 family protein [Polyangiaceae bacterium]
MSGDARQGAHGFSADVAWIRAQFQKGVPSYFALLGHVQTMLEAPHSELQRALDRAWTGRTFHVAYDRPLLFLAALRADALTEGPSHPLYRAIGTDRPEPEQVDDVCVRDALAADRTRLFAWLATRRVQTNDTLRSIAWRWPAYLAGCEGGALPVALVDLGASAGLNLVAERLPAVWTDGRGVAIPAVTAVRAVVRLGLDARPVDLADPENVTWMRACIWPGDRGRLERLEVGLRAFYDAAREGAAPVLEQADVTAFAARVARLAVAHSDALVLVYQTVLRDYLSPELRRAHHAAMYEWLGAFAPGRGVWVELESRSTDAEHPEPAALTAHARCPEGQVRAFEIARTLHHPIEVKPMAEAVRELERALRSR